MEQPHPPPSRLAQLRKSTDLGCATGSEAYRLRGPIMSSACRLLLRGGVGACAGVLDTAEEAQGLLKKAKEFFFFFLLQDPKSPKN